MILCIDIGNTTISSGVYQQNDLIAKFSMATNKLLTKDEYGVKYLEFLKHFNISSKDIKGIIISSVVPKVDYAFKQLSIEFFNIEPIVVAMGVKSGINIKILHPKQLGSDLLVGAVGAVYKYQPHCLVIDMGTAITFSYINKQKEFLGGSIVPGINSSMQGLITNASLLEQVRVDEAKVLIGNDTKSCLQSGLVYGFTNLIDGMINDFKKQVGNDVIVILTGGDSRIVTPHLKSQFVYDENLLLDGLRILYDKNI